MNSKIGRPKMENPKNIDVKVRFDEETNKKVLRHCEKKNTTKTNLIREGVKNQIALENGLEQKDIEEYENYLDELKNKKIDTLDLKSIEGEISNLNEKLDELYGLLTKLRDKYLKEEYDMTYEKILEKGLTVNMPIKADIFFLQNNYYKILMNLYDIRINLKYKYNSKHKVLGN